MNDKENIRPGEQAERETSPGRRKSDELLAQATQRNRAQVDRLQDLLSAQEDALSDAQSSIDVRDEFLAIVSHDLRNPLNAIRLNTELLRRLSSGDKRTDRIAQVLDDSTAQMERIISDLQDLAAIEAKKLTLDLKSEDLRSPIEAVVPAFEPIVAERSASIRKVLPDNPIPARFDNGRLLQVLQNLLANAVKFTPENGMVSVEAERVGDFAEVRIKDTGIGIPTSELTTIFERFRQVEKRGRRGLGLGLYISRSIIEAHGGKIRVESVFGQGSTFTFTIPAI